MLLISAYHDYYDTALGYGVDKTIVYNRNIQDVLLATSNYFKHEDDRHHTKKVIYEFTSYQIGFCGSIYPGIEVVENITGVHNKYVLQPPRYFYVKEDFLAFLTSIGVKTKKESFWYSFLRDKSFKTIRLASLQSLEDFFKVSNYNRYLDLFDKHKVPIFKIKKEMVTLNPCLKVLNFQTVKDPFAAFQDIQSYISGVLGTPERPMVKISDKDMASKRGHDGKYSFKTPPK